MSWHGVAGAHSAAVAGNDTILAPDPALYFDHRQSTLPTEPPGRLDVISLEDVYRFEPHDATLDVDQQPHVLGVQGNLWTEHIKTEERLQWMALPRAAALAEVGWSAAPRRRWTDFLDRLVAHVGALSSVRTQLCGQRVRAGRGDCTRSRRASLYACRIRRKRRRVEPHPLHARRPRTLRRNRPRMTHP